MSKTSLSTDQELRRGESLVSANKEYTAILQTDNNFVIYNKAGTPTWATATNAKDCFRLLLQSDGNLVIYNKADKAVWHTGTQSGSHRMRLTMTSEGHLILDNNGVTTWSSQHSKGIIG